jgi:hypothetical protein
MSGTNIAIDKDEILALGTSLRLIDQKLLNATKEEGTRRVWYQGGEPYFDVFVELRGEDIEWFQLTLRGRSISWNRQKSGWQTGITNEMRIDDVTFYPASKLIQTDDRTDSSFLQLAQAILQTRAGEDIFDKMLALFEKS